MWVKYYTKAAVVYGAFPYLCKKKDPRGRGKEQPAAGSEQAKRIAQGAKSRALCAMRFARGSADPGATAGHRGG